MTPVVTWTTLSDSPLPLFWMRKKIRSTYPLVRRTVMNCVLSAKGVFEKVQWVRRERRSVEQSGSCSGVSFGISLIDPYQCINIIKWRLTFVCTISRISTKQNGRENEKTKYVYYQPHSQSLPAGWFASLQVWEISKSSKLASTLLILWRP